MRGDGRLLMCAPAHYGVEYVINPWMAGNIHRVVHEHALEQWQALRERLEGIVQVELVDPVAGLPDMVFTANGGLLLGKKAVVSRFFYRERQGESERFRQWFKGAGYEVLELPGDLPFEGEGDALLDPERGLLWVGYGMRTDLGAHPALAELLDLRVVSLRLEQALLGTSLGVDLVRGTPVDHGHRHHLAAINAIRRCGGIAQAVEQGVLTRGVFYECVRAGVPFALAGSIRDDGPLPDTQMNLVQAQDDYARLVRDADMILMLSSMLHSIGVGNMTPSGVRLACIDINPAVVTKLADRGSLESVGVVTDVGLFLSLLVQRLGL